MNEWFIGAYLSHNAANRDLNGIKGIFFLRNNITVSVMLYSDIAHVCNFIISAYSTNN